MANLDDFFAKKDKKKKKQGGFSKANTDVLAKNLEEQDRKEMLSASEQASRGPLATSEATKLALETTDIELAGNSRQNSQTDDDWFEYKKEKDYSDLKIKNLMIEHPEDNEDDDEHEVNEDGQKVLKVKGESVWSKSQTQTNNQTATENSSNDDSKNENRSSNSNDASSSAHDASSNAAGDSSRTSSSSAPSTAAAAVAATTTNKYVPPHERNNTAASGNTLAPVRLAGMSRSHGMRNRAAPDINSEVYFPSLGGSAVESSRHTGPIIASCWSDSNNRFRDGRDDFEEVRSGGSTGSSKAMDAPKLSLDNKFGALSE